MYFIYGLGLWKLILLWLWPYFRLTLSRVGLPEKKSHWSGITLTDVRLLAFELAENNKIEHFSILQKKEKDYWKMAARLFFKAILTIYSVNQMLSPQLRLYGVWPDAICNEIFVLACNFISLAYLHNVSC